MPLDPKITQYLDPTKPITEFAGMTAPPEAVARYQAYREKEYTDRAGKFCEDMMDFFLHQREKCGYLDDECVGALALLTINLRTLYGDPQTEEEATRWTEEEREKKLEIFDSICSEMQRYFDLNKDNA